MSLADYRGPYNPRHPTPGGEARISIYNYVPALALGLIGVILFGLAFIGHSYLWWTGSSKKAESKVGTGRGTRWFEGLWILGCVMEVLGYAFRLRSHYNPFYINAFILQYFFIVVSPVFFAAALYLSLQHAINLNPGNLHHSPVKRSFVAIFITSDSLTTVIQIVGAALVGVTESRVSNGKGGTMTTGQANDILLAGLALQNASFLIFLMIIGIIILRLRNVPRCPLSVIDEKRRRSSGQQSLTTIEDGLIGNETAHTFTKTFLTVLIVSSLLIFARTLYRLAETAEGVWGTASSSEALFGVFEFAPVVLATWLWLARPLRGEMQRMA